MEWSGCGEIPQPDEDELDCKTAATELRESINKSKEFWGENDYDGESTIIPANILKCPPTASEKAIKCEEKEVITNLKAASELAHLAWDVMTQSDFEEVARINRDLLTNGEIATNNLIPQIKNILSKIIDKNNIEKNLKRIDDNYNQAIILVANQLLYIFDENVPPSIAKDEAADLNPKLCPNNNNNYNKIAPKSKAKYKDTNDRINELLEKAVEQGLGEIKLPKCGYINERTKLALLERQIKGRLRLKGIFENDNNNLRRTGNKQLSPQLRNNDVMKSPIKKTKIKTSSSKICKHIDTGKNAKILRDKIRKPQQVNNKVTDDQKFKDDNIIKSNSYLKKTGGRNQQVNESNNSLLDIASTSQSITMSINSGNVDEFVQSNCTLEALLQNASDKAEGETNIGQEFEINDNPTGQNGLEMEDCLSEPSLGTMLQNAIVNNNVKEFVVGNKCKGLPELSENVQINENDYVLKQPEESSLKLIQNQPGQSNDAGKDFLENERNQTMKDENDSSINSSNLSLKDSNNESRNTLSVMKIIENISKVTLSNSKEDNSRLSFKSVQENKSKHSLKENESDKVNLSQKSFHDNRSQLNVKEVKERYSKLSLKDNEGNKSKVSLSRIQESGNSSDHMTIPENTTVSQKEMDEIRNRIRNKLSLKDVQENRSEFSLKWNQDKINNPDLMESTGNLMQMDLEDRNKLSLKEIKDRICSLIQPSGQDNRSNLTQPLIGKNRSKSSIQETRSKLSWKENQSRQDVIQSSDSKTIAHTDSEMEMARSKSLFDKCKSNNQINQNSLSINKDSQVIIKDKSNSRCNLALKEMTDLRNKVCFKDSYVQEDRRKVSSKEIQDKCSRAMLFMNGTQSDNELLQANINFPMDNDSYNNDNRFYDNSQSSFAGTPTNNAPTAVSEFEAESIITNDQSKISKDLSLILRETIAAIHAKTNLHDLTTFEPNKITSDSKSVVSNNQLLNGNELKMKSNQYAIEKEAFETDYKSLIQKDTSSHEMGEKKFMFARKDSLNNLAFEERVVSSDDENDRIGSGINYNYFEEDEMIKKSEEQKVCESCKFKVLAASEEFKKEIDELEDVNDNLNMYTNLASTAREYEDNDEFKEETQNEEAQETSENKTEEEKEEITDFNVNNKESVEMVTKLNQHLDEDENDEEDDEDEDEEDDEEEVEDDEESNCEMSSKSEATSDCEKSEDDSVKAEETEQQNLDPENNSEVANTEPLKKAPETEADKKKRRSSFGRGDNSLLYITIFLGVFTATYFSEYGRHFVSDVVFSGIKSNAISCLDRAINAMTILKGKLQRS